MSDTVRPADIPKFSIEPDILSMIIEIDRAKASIGNDRPKGTDVVLRKRTNIRSVNSSLAIEGNGLGLEKVSDIINGKRVVGPFDEIVEVKNAIKAYDMIGQFDVYSVSDLIEMNDIMMFGLVERPGLRDCGVAVYEGDEIRHKAPDKDLVEPMLIRLMEWASSSGYPSYIKGAVVHYYIEYIHPFTDGNGRTGRLWHTAILCSEDPVFRSVPLESKIYEHQSEYYDVLGRSDSAGDCTEFVRFSLRLTMESLKDILRSDDRKISELMEAMDDGPMTSSEIMERMGLSSKQNFLKNYIRPALGLGLITMTSPDSPNSRTQRYRKVSKTYSGRRYGSPGPLRNY